MILLTMSKGVRIMYCPNCGAKVDEKAVVCVKCGVSLKKETNNTNQPEKSGAATASMVLGILGLIFGVITLLIALGVSSYASNSLEMQLYGSISSSYEEEKLATAIGIIFLPGILSLIGFILAITSRGKVKNGSNSAGLVLNIITIILCVIQFLMITSM